MKIAVDLRSLSTGTISGVENYILNLLDHMLAQDKKNTYVLFYNSWKGETVGDLQRINSQVFKTKIPNRLLNLGFKLGLADLKKTLGEFDCLFLPNLNPFGYKGRGKLVLTVHDLSPIVTPEFYDLKRRLWHKFLNYRKAFERADRIFAVSEHTKKDIVRLFGVPESKIQTAYPGVDKNLFRLGVDAGAKREVRNIYSLPGDFILFLNTLEPRKNLVNLIRAFEQLKSPVSLVVAGRLGWKYREILKAMGTGKKAGKIHYIGYVPERHKPALISLAKALVYPSFYEGFGFQPLEAMSCGVPTVVSQVSSLPEVAGDASLLVDPYNPESLSRALELVLTDNNLRSRLIDKGLERAKVFDWQTAARTILEGLNSL